MRRLDIRLSNVCEVRACQQHLGQGGRVEAEAAVADGEAQRGAEHGVCQQLLYVVRGGGGGVHSAGWGGVRV